MIDLKILKTNEDRNQYSLLCEPIGKLKSGYARYGAAMYFYEKGHLTDQMLEIYRICSKFDNQDPQKVAQIYKDK